MTSPIRTTKPDGRRRNAIDAGAPTGGTLVDGAVADRARHRDPARLAGRVGPAGRQLLHLQSARCRPRVCYRWTLDGSIFLHLWATLYATALGFVIGSSVGAVLGVWLGVSPFASRLLNPYLNALNALPKVALAPLFVLWFGLGIESKIALAAVLVLFLVFLNTFAGVRAGRSGSDRRRAADAGDARAGHHQSHHAVGDVVAVRRA